MIVKKVAFNKSAAPRSKARHVRDLCDYIAGPSAGDKDEKVEHRGALNLLNIDHDAQICEMGDLAETAKRSPQPVQHWILSWRQGEQPTAAQADDAARIFLGEMGLAEQQTVYALHRNTDNCHLHLAINRVHPETERVVTVNGGFDIEVAHRAIARIEHEQEWERERGGRYQVREDGLVQRAAEVPTREREPTAAARDFENLTGQRSAQRIVIEEGAELMRRAQSWRELHALLAERGMQFERKGSGAIVRVGEAVVKASCAGRECSMSALEKRLGGFLPSREPFEMHARVPEPAGPLGRNWAKYVTEMQAHYAAKKHEREQLRDRHGRQWSAMTRQHRAERTESLGGDWRGRGDALNAMRSMLAARQARDKAALKEHQQLERHASRDRLPPWPEFERWLRERDRADLAERWRFRERTTATVEGDHADPPQPRDIRAFAAEAEGRDVVYRRLGRREDVASFVDQGPRIVIHDRKPDSVLAALQLSAQKWRTFRVSGSEEYKRMCVELAAEHGFRISNPELQASIAAERQQRREQCRAKPEAPENARPDHQRKQVRMPVRDVNEAYERHHEDVLRQSDGKRQDASRLDALVAIRLRMTGHDRAEVEKTIRSAAASARPLEVRDWNEYARRTGEHAFGLSGERDSREKVKDRDALFRLEGRTPSRERSLELPPFRNRDRDYGR